eukprot:TRINITY_DN7182_c0_g1_i1.p1 TRINITY_DN7182_c0_g1~~TRINITY_DN7182_c0_g1_i1.p1  ORF type:complete len:246 (+),score=50.16 TRINITY_DN7182_c0_g1_i1:52-789(+)
MDVVKAKYDETKHRVHEALMAATTREHSGGSFASKGLLSETEFSEAAKMMQEYGWKYQEDLKLLVYENARCDRRYDEEPEEEPTQETTPTQACTQATVDTESTDEDAVDEDAVCITTNPHSAKTRYYCLYVGYHKHFGVPTCYFTGYTKEGRQLTCDEILEDVQLRGLVTPATCKEAGSQTMMHIHACTHNEKLHARQAKEVQPKSRHHFAVSSYLRYVSHQILPFVDFDTGPVTKTIFPQEQEE